MRFVTRLGCIVFLALLAAPVFAQTPSNSIRVRILEREQPREVRVTAQEVPIAVYADGQRVGSIARGASGSIERDRGSVRLRFEGVREQAQRVELVPEGDAQLALAAGDVRRSYAGRLAVWQTAGTLVLVNTVDLEEYVAAVVAGEYPFPEIEGVKAQAILARTFALQMVDRARYDGYDLVDDTRDQVYHGAGRATATSRRGAEATRGEVLTFGGDLATAVYSSSSGGHTASNESVWDGAPLPYLRGRPDPFDTHSPHHRWTGRAARAGVHRALSQRFGFNVTGFELEPPGADGRVRRVRLQGSQSRSVSANAFRLAITGRFGWRVLRSTRFAASRSGSDYVFTGGGFGHGVGMSQYGAQAQAQAGRSYRDILAFYFEGTSLEHRSGGDAVYLAATPPAPEGVRTRPTPRREAAAQSAREEALERLRARAAGTPPVEERPAERPARPRRRAW